MSRFPAPHRPTPPTATEPVPTEPVPTAFPAAPARPGVRTWIIWLICMIVLGGLYLVMSQLLAPRSAVFSAEDGGTLQLPRQRDGHFYVEGHINNAPVLFMIDTGASIVSISEATAAAAGLQGGRQTQFSTANGMREGLIQRAATLSFSGFVLQDVEVGTGLTMENIASRRTRQQALLGQNVLRHFHVTMDGNTMQLRQK